MDVERLYNPAPLKYHHHHDWNEDEALPKSKIKQPTLPRVQRKKIMIKDDSNEDCEPEHALIRRPTMIAREQQYINTGK